MSKDLSKAELVRLSWLTELRRQGDRKCVGPRNGKGGVCALELLSEITGIPGHVEAARSVGITTHPRDAWNIACRNDGHDGYHQHTFAEIADVVEGWFK